MSVLEQIMSFTQIAFAPMMILIFVPTIARLSSTKRNAGKVLLSLGPWLPRWVPRLGIAVFGIYFAATLVLLVIAIRENEGTQITRLLRGVLMPAVVFGFFVWQSRLAVEIRANGVLRGVTLTPWSDVKDARWDDTLKRLVVRTRWAVLHLRVDEARAVEAERLIASRLAPKASG